MKVVSVVKYLMFALLLTLAVTACAPAAPAPAPIDQVSTTDGSTAGDAATLTPVTLGVGFIPSVQFAPFYVGIEQGFYAEEGLDVTLDYGFENDYLKLVGTGAMPFMIGSGDQVVLGRAQGLPVRYVMNWYTQYPVVVFAKEESGIAEPKDLAGKTVGIPGPFGASYVAYRGVLEAAGLTEADVTLESIGFTQAAAISQGTVDAAVDYAASGPVTLALENVPTTQIKIDQYLHIPANGLVTNDTTIADDPELIAKMVRATAKSIAFTLANPDEAFASALRFVPEAGGDNEAANRAIFDASLAFWTPVAETPPGTTRLEDWQTAADFMARIGLVDTVVPADSLFTNEFVETE